jgi:hypothetical protein
MYAVSSFSFYRRGVQVSDICFLNLPTSAAGDWWHIYSTVMQVKHNESRGYNLTFHSSRGGN